VKLYLAPIKGVTDCVYRNAFGRRFAGIDAAVAPFVSSVRSRKIKPSYLKDLSPQDNTILPLVPQILGNDGADFVWMAQRIMELGYNAVNWNLGCPVPMVAKKRRGSGLLPYPDKIRGFLDTVCAALPGRVSVKVRLGRRSPDELMALLPVFNDYPLAEVVIHPRLGVQMYKGGVDLDAFGRCLPLCRHPVVYNGDIADPVFFSTLRRRFPTVRRFMLGRGLLRDPFLAGVVAAEGNPALKTLDRKAILHDFHSELYETYSRRLNGPGHLLGRMKAVWAYLSGAFADERRVWKRIKKAQGLDRYEEAVEDIFGSMELRPAVPATRQGAAAP